jgi:hypothetical protein
MDPDSTRRPLVSEEDAALFAEFGNAVSQARKAWQNSVKPILSHFAEQVRPLLEAVQAIDWEVVTKKVREASKKRQVRICRLAQLGWTVGPRVPFLVEMGDSVASDQDSVDAYFVEIYRENSRATTKNVFKQLKVSPHLSNWGVLLDQIASALEQEAFVLVVPGLLIMFEGYMAKLAYGANERRGTDAIRRVKQVKLNAQSSTAPFLAEIWLGMVVFLEELFKTSDFTTEAPAFINRHWILHGRDAAEWKEADAIRLLNALSTLDWLIVNPIPKSGEL